jgi:hypothetical protein
MFAAIGSVLFGAGEETPANDVDVAEAPNMFAAIGSVLFEHVVEMTNNPSIDVVHVDFCLHQKIAAPFLSFKAPTYELQRKVDSTRRETYSISSCTELSCGTYLEEVKLKLERTSSPHMARIIYDTRPLGRLVNLTSLTLSRQTRDMIDFRSLNIAPLGSLINLQRLTMEGNNIRDLEPLRTLVSLVELDLSGNSIENVEPLAPLTSLQKLNLKRNKIRHTLAPLNRLIHLTDLNLRENSEIVNIAPIGQLVDAGNTHLAIRLHFCQAYTRIFPRAYSQPNFLILYPLQ